MSIEWSFDSGLNTETEPNAEIESPCLLNTLRRDLDKLLNRSGVRSPISTLRAKEKHTVLQKIKEICSDEESMSLFKTNFLLKGYLLNTATSLIDKSLNDDFLKKILKVLSYLLDADYNHKKKCFLYPSLLPMYGKILLRLIPLLSDLAIDESFYCTKGIPSSEFQCHFLALTNFAIKTIELKSLLSLGMKPKHLQFLIIHFASSIMTTEILLSVAENLSGQNVLYQTNQEYPERKYITDILDIYTVAMNSTKLLTKLYLFDFKVLETVKHINLFLARFGNERLMKANFMNTILKQTQYVLKELFNCLKVEADSKYRALKYQQMSMYLQLFACHFDNLNDCLKQKWSKYIVSVTKRILARITQTQTLRKLLRHEIAAKNLCFSLIIKLIENNHEEFFENHCDESEDNIRIFFQDTWFEGISNQNEFACLAFISFIRIKEKDGLSTDYSHTYNFTKSVIKLIDQKIDKKQEAEFHIESFALHMRIVIAIGDYYSANLFKSTLKTELMPLVNKMVHKVHGLLHQDAIYLNLFVQFQIKLFQCLFTSKYRPTALMRDHTVTCVQIFEDILNFNFGFKIEDMAYFLAMELIGLIIRYYSVEKLFQEYNSTLFEMLLLIDTHINEDAVDYQVNKLEIERLINILNRNEA